ncbi:MAG: hypothetical protein ABJA98_02900 [Acidobacteriota bacterium]
MLFNTDVNDPSIPVGQNRRLSAGGAIRVFMVIGFLVTLALSAPRRLTAADDGHGPGCSNRTLRGDYGILVSGIVPAGPDGQTEMVIGTTLRRYDGRGNFTEVSNAHGQRSGAVEGREGYGTYRVNVDCTGSTTLFVVGLPFPTETSMVIVDDGREVKEVVMSPPPALVTAVQTRVTR